jgi:hypothetical protein
MKRWIAGLGAACVLGAAGLADAGDARGFFPLRVGNTWTYDSGAVMKVEDAFGSVFRVSGIPTLDEQLLLWSGSTLLVFDSADARFEPLFRFGAETGTTYNVRLGDTPLWQSVKVTVGERGHAAHLAGADLYLPDCIDFAFEASGVADAGPLAATFCQDRGLVAYTELTFAGPRDAELVSAELGRKDFSVAGPEIFEPRLRLVEEDGRSTLKTVTQLPTPCFSIESAELTAPPFVLVSTDTLAVTLTVVERGEVCPEVVVEAERDVALAPADLAGKTQISVFVVKAGELVGSASTPVAPFAPVLVLTRELDGEFTLDAVVRVPYDCYAPLAAVPGAPPNVRLIPEALPVLLDITVRSGECRPTSQPLQFRLRNLRLRPGRFFVTAFAWVGGPPVLGTATVSPRSSGRED